MSCKSLTYLDLSVNNLEKIPDAITSLLGLEELYLNDTFLEFLPANFGRLVNLRILELRDNNLITLPKSMSRLTQLRRIDIGNNEFTELPEVIGHLVSLRELWCDGNRIRRINCNVSTLKDLIHFDGSNNLLQSLPTDIGNWQRCQELCLSTNELEELPFSIGMMKSLVALKVDENQLQELPDSISELQNLEELMVSHNDLFRLPTTIGLLRQLRFLTADENLLRILPNEVCSCSALTILSVRGNKLTKIPVDIGRLTNLRVLNIVNNFIAQLPVTILNLRQLSALWISDNQGQPLMPLQKEFNEETQFYYLSCFLLPQTMNSTSRSTTTSQDERNSVSTPNSQTTTYDYYGAQRHGDPPKNAHLTALENLSLAALANHASNTPNNKRRICFASEPAQEVTIDPNSRLMRSPTPYPKELRMMSKFAAKNTNQQQQTSQSPQHQQHVVSAQKYSTQKTLVNNFDDVDASYNEKLLNTANNYANEIELSQLTNLNNMDGVNDHTLNIPMPPLNHGNQSDPNDDLNAARNANINISTIVDQQKLANEALAYHHLHRKQQQQPQHLQPQPQQLAQHLYTGNNFHSPNIAYEYEHRNPIENQFDSNYHCDPLLNRLPPHIPLVTPVDTNQLVEYESFNDKNNKKYAPSIENSSSYSSSKRVSQASSSNSFGVDETTPLENQMHHQHQRLQPNHVISYAETIKPNPTVNENIFYSKIMQSKPAPNVQMSLPHTAIATSDSENNFYPTNSVDDNDHDHDSISDNGDVNKRLLDQSLQQQPPPYHIAKAFTKKTKHDLLIYDIYRNNYQQKPPPNMQNQPSNRHSNATNGIASNNLHLDSNSNASELNGSAVDTSDTNDNKLLIDRQSNCEIISPAAVNHNQSTASSSSTSSWVFGLHKNPTVVSFPRVRFIHSSL